MCVCRYWDWSGDRGASAERRWMRLCEPKMLATGSRSATRATGCAGAKEAWLVCVGRRCVRGDNVADEGGG